MNGLFIFRRILSISLSSKGIYPIMKKLSQDSLNNSSTQTSLIQSYIQRQAINKAYRLFLNMTNKSNDIYRIMIKGLVSNNMLEKVLDLFDDINIQPSPIILTMLFGVCARINNDRAKETGKKFLNQASNEMLNDNILLTSAINMLMKFGDVKNAEDYFDIIKNKNIITYGAMLKGYTLNNMCDKALDLYEQIKLKHNNITYTILLNACAQLSTNRAKEIGKKLLHQISKDLPHDNILLTSALDMLMKFGDIKKAEELFHLIKTKDIIIYGAMMKGYTSNNMCEKALDLYQQVQLNHNNITYSILFNTCAELSTNRAKEIGNKLLREMPKKFKEYNYINNSAIDMLMKFGDIKNAEILFQTIKKKDIITYGAMMKGYNINNEPLKSLKLFEEMKKNNIIIDEIISIILIDTCAKIGIRSMCQSIVNQISPHLLDNQQIKNALISMWGKAGLVKNAQQIFELVDQPDVITYNAMINAYGKNLLGLEAVDLYRKMPVNLRDKISYVSVLNACSHSGLFDEAYSIFNKISNKTKNVVTTMVDCASRLFLFDEAKKLIEDYEKYNAPYSVMYMALLSGARNARNSHLSKEVYQKIKVLFPNEKNVLISASILLCNISSSLGRHEEAQTIRLDRIKELGNKVKAGLSWTEVNGEVVQFTAHDQSHPRSKEIYAEAQRISSELIKYGHVHDASWITRPLREHETAESVLCSHSERLAIAFNFIEGRKPSSIQITNNLRVCGDCHQATKLIAKIRQVEIVVRDANCIHHFSTNGTCSCQDHF
ncbi:unnamed protein product [Adineta steineri]|uniref:DYW domain-containing protein n=1 Tax=Adineta steineri TaxID=433720 RepID=A0A815CQE0_9BILA|nr:unnamed protein product [Adineta steineri]CAF1354338.1 unnamed protein product [Adineta steineri]